MASTYGSSRLWTKEDGLLGSSLKLDVDTSAKQFQVGVVSTATSVLILFFAGCSVVRCCSCYRCELRTVDRRNIT
jgi:hypothetical protein